MDRFSYSSNSAPLEEVRDRSWCRKSVWSLRIDSLMKHNQSINADDNHTDHPVINYHETKGNRKEDNVLNIMPLWVVL